MTRYQFLAVAALAALTLGCGGPSYVPVSGVITLDGKPYGKAVVNFQPIGTPDNPNPGRGSAAYTDESGRFVLLSDDHKGAVVGKHRVTVATREDSIGKASTEGGTPDDAPTFRRGEPIPPEWNSMSDKQFDVPAGGTDKANFDIVTKK